MGLPNLGHRPCCAARYEVMSLEPGDYGMVAAHLDLRLLRRHHLLPLLLASGALVGLAPPGANAPGLHAPHHPSAACGTSLL